MACKYHVAGAVGDAVVGISGKVIKELEHVRIFSLVGKDCCWTSSLRANRILLSTALE